MGAYWKCKCCGSAKPVSKFPTPKQFMEKCGSSFVDLCLQCIWHLDRPEYLERASIGIARHDAWIAANPDYVDNSYPSRSTALTSAYAAAAWRKKEDE